MRYAILSLVLLVVGCHAFRLGFPTIGSIKDDAILKPHSATPPPLRWRPSLPGRFASRQHSIQDWVERQELLARG